MDMSIFFQEEAGCLVCSISGKWVTDELKSFIDRASAEIKKQGHSRLLVDMYTVSGPPPEMDRFNIGKYVASVLRWIKIAVIYQKVYSNNFFEDTAVNRGAWIKVFPDQKTAMQWLMEDYPKKANPGDPQ